MSRSREKADLIARLEASRTALGQDLSQMGESLDLPRRLRLSVRRHPVGWIGGGVALGAIASMLLRPGRRGEGSRGSFLGGASDLAHQLLQFSLLPLSQFLAAELDRFARRPPRPTGPSPGGSTEPTPGRIEEGPVGE